MSETTQDPRQPHTYPSKARSGALVVTLWVFGLATSLFLLGMWGRTVAVDSTTIEESARTVIDAEIATERINAWFEEGLATVADLDSEAAHSVVEAIEARPEYDDAIDSIIGGFVDSLFAPEGANTVVDLERALAPLVPVIADEFDRRDVPVEESQIREVLDDAGVVDLDAGEARSVAAVVADARVFLTQVVLMSLLALVATGALAVFLADERLSMVRQLATRVAVAAMSYAVILRLAGWALDPGRGRSPVAGATAVLFNSNTFVLLALGVAGAVVAVAVFLVMRGRTGESGCISQDRADDDTREMASV